MGLRVYNPIRRIIVMTLLGWLCTVVGFIGVFVPLLPSTPFFLLAVYCFDKSSPRFSDWLRTNRFSGPTLVDWEKNRVIRPRAKILATVFISASGGYLIFATGRPLFIKVLVVGISVGVLAFLLSRPSRPMR